MIDSVLLPALFVVLGAERLLLAITYGADAIDGNSFLYQRLLYRLRAAGSQGDVVFLRSTVVAMAFNQNLDAWMLREEGFIVLDLGCFVRPDRVFVVIEEHIFDVPAEQVLIRG